MNVQNNINKLLIGIRQKGKDIRLDTRMFYSCKLNKWITSYTFSEKSLVEKKDGQKVEKWIEIWSGCNKATLVKNMADYYKKIGSEADE